MHRDWKTFIKNVFYALSALVFLLLFQNCGVQRPQVQGETGMSSAAAVAFHEKFTPETNCASCHQTDRPSAKTPLHNFDHMRADFQATDCNTCHFQKESWGLTWAGGQYKHDPLPSTCMECHINQRPKAAVTLSSNPAQVYVHTAGTECSTCHTSTSKFSQLSDWRPASTLPSGLAGTKTFNIFARTFSFNGATKTMSGAISKTLKLEIDHDHPQVSPLACTACHGAGASTGQFAGALFHKNISSNPSACAQCHINAQPVDLAVGGKSFMVHNAVRWNSNPNGSVSRGTQAVFQSDCASCHLNAPSMPQAGSSPVAGSAPFSKANFHANLPASSLGSCLDCHAQSRPTSSASFTDPNWKNKTNTGAPPFTTFDFARHATNVDCTTCHKAPEIASPTVANWAQGYYLHSSQTSNCLNCHTANGVTSTNHNGFISNCVSCHLGATSSFPNPVIADWKNNVTGTLPSGVVGEKSLPNALKCTGVAGALPNCVPANPNIIVKGMNHAVNSKGVSCQNCHGTGPASSTNGKFHTPPTGITNWIAPASTDLVNCTQCHDPATVPSNLASIKNVGVVGSQLRISTGTAPYAGVHHGIASLSAKQCSDCHTAPAPSAASNWNQAKKIHSVLAPSQVTSCSECHYKRMPSGVLPRKNQVSYKGTHNPQNFTHTSTQSLPSVASQQCASCHTSAGGSWTAAGQVSFHNKITVSNNCQLCHVAPTGTVTSSTSGVSFNHSQVANLGDCVTCHQSTRSKVVGRIPTAADWDGGTSVPSTYTIPSHVSSGITIPGYTGTHSTNPNCTACHGTGNYAQITDFDHQGLPADQNSCVSCHLGAKADVAAFIASTSGIGMKTMGDRHHPTSIFKGKNTSCVGCHTTVRGANTFASANGIVYPTASKQAYTAVGCGSVSGSTFSCHSGGQRTMVVPATTGTSGRWK